MLSQENIKKLVKGGIYSATSFANSCSQRSDGMNQRYSFWVPVRIKESTDYAGRTIPEKWYMINTYQIERPKIGKFKDCLEYLENIFDNGKYAVANTTNYYYSANVELSDRIMKEFELIADLHDYKEEEYRNQADDYSEEDVVTGTKLYFEHAYPYGINLIKKNAKPNISNQIKNISSEILQGINNPSCYASKDKIEDLKNKIAYAKENNIDFDEGCVKRSLEYYEDIQKTIEFWNNLRKARKY